MLYPTEHCYAQVGGNENTSSTATEFALLQKGWTNLSVHFCGTVTALCASPVYRHFFVEQGYALSWGKGELPKEGEIQRLWGAPYCLEDKDGLIEDKHPFIKDR